MTLEVTGVWWISGPRSWKLGSSAQSQALTELTHTLMSCVSCLCDCMYEWVSDGDRGRVIVKCPWNSVLYLYHFQRTSFWWAQRTPRILSFMQCSQHPGIFNDLICLKPIRVLLTLPSNMLISVCFSIAVISLKALQCACTAWLM